MLSRQWGARLTLRHCCTRMLLSVTAACHAYQVDLANKPQEFVELYHSIVPDRDVRERVPVLVHGPKRLVDHATIVVSVDSYRSGSHTSCKPQAFTPRLPCMCTSLQVMLVMAMQGIIGSVWSV